MKISIIGLGYVGVVSLACLARDGHHVVGVDIDKHKLDMIRDGRSPIVEEGIQELISDVIGSGRVTVTDSVCHALRETALSLICVGTPSLPNGSQDQSALLTIANQFGEALKDKPEPHVFVFRSTMLPGTVEDKLTPLIEQKSGKKCHVDFEVCYQPEFLREGSSIRDYDHPPFTIVGAQSERAADLLRQVFGHLPCKFQVTSVRAAEMVKFCCNTFHALKITFANEVARLCEALGLSPFEVMELVCQDKHLNISAAYLRPGFAFGGSCLPKDLRALTYVARQTDVSVPMLSNILNSNQEHVDHAVQKILRLGVRKVALIGLAFKSGTDDLRESPLVALVEQLIGKGIDLAIYDNEVLLSRLLGANRRYIEYHIPHIGNLLRSDLPEVLDHANVVILGSSDSLVQAELRTLLRPSHRLLDLVAMKDAENLPCLYEGLCW